MPAAFRKVACSYKDCAEIAAWRPVLVVRAEELGISLDVKVHVAVCQGHRNLGKVDDFFDYGEAKNGLYRASCAAFFNAYRKRVDRSLTTLRWVSL